MRGKGKGRGASTRPSFCQFARLLRPCRANMRASALRAGREEEGSGGAALSLELVCQCSHVWPPPMAVVASEPKRWRTAASARNSVHAHKMAAWTVHLTGSGRLGTYGGPTAQTHNIKLFFKKKGQLWQKPRGTTVPPPVNNYPRTAHKNAQAATTKSHARL